MAEVTTEQSLILETPSFRQKGPFVLANLTSGHGLFHWFSQSLTFMLPEIRDTFGISTGLSMMKETNWEGSSHPDSSQVASSEGGIGA